ncbi:hypothetical protein CI238_10414, partial [Colletotrichum incanum]
HTAHPQRHLLNFLFFFICYYQLQYFILSRCTSLRSLSLALLTPPALLPLHAVSTHGSTARLSLITAVGERARRLAPTRTRAVPIVEPAQPTAPSKARVSARTLCAMASRSLQLVMPTVALLLPVGVSVARNKGNLRTMGRIIAMARSAGLLATTCR